MLSGKLVKLRRVAVLEVIKVLFISAVEFDRTKVRFAKFISVRVMFIAMEFTFFVVPFESVGEVKSIRGLAVSITIVLLAVVFIVPAVSFMLTL